MSEDELNVVAIDSTSRAADNVQKSAQTEKATPTKGQPDPHGDDVEKIYISTAEFVIYTVASRDHSRLRYFMPTTDYEKAKLMRLGLTPITGLLALIDDVVCDLRARAEEANWSALRERTTDLQARAMQLAFEGQGTRAVDLLSTVRAEVENRRDSRNRMDYVFANLIALVCTLSLWLVFEGLPFPWFLLDLHALLVEPILLSPGLPGFRAIDVLALGALGAFFSVSLGIRSVRINHAIRRFEMLYSGFVRVTIGVIAAAVAIMLIKGGWILAAIEPSYMIWTVYLFGFLAGFSEAFVPNALNRVESSSNVQTPASRTPA